MVKNTIKFSLDRPKSAKLTYIFLRYPCKDGYLKYSTKLSVLPKDWDTELQQSVSDRSLNSSLNKIYTIVEEYLDYCRVMKKLDIYKADIIKEIDEKLNRKEKVVTKEGYFFTCIDKLTDDAEAGRLLTPKNTKYTSGSIKNWRKTRNRLYDFDPNLDFSTITIITYNSFIQWCNAQDYSLNYTSALVKDWKTFMELAKDKGFSKNMIHKDKAFKRVNEESFQVSLNEEEIGALYNLDLSRSKYLEQIRDRFIINLYTGLRISDMKTLTLKNFQNEMITHLNRKTGKKVVIPVHHMIEEIRLKYNGELPKQYQDQIVNREIKKIAKDAGLTELVYFTKTIGGVRTNFCNEKWEMISNHCARRTMATELLKHADVIDVMPVLGMSLKTLQGYNKRSHEENAQMLKSNPFFTKK